MHDALPPKSVLIAGGSGGLGAAIARRLADEGSVLTLVARTPTGLPRCPSRRGASRWIFGCRAQLGAAVDAAVEHAGGLDVVVNAVGVVAFGPVAELSIDAMEEVFLTNVFVPIMLAQAASQHLRPGGVIVNISGVIAEQNLPGMAAYGASKAAVRSFDEGFAREARRAKSESWTPDLRTPRQGLPAGRSRVRRRRCPRDSQPKRSLRSSSTPSRAM